MIDLSYISKLVAEYTNEDLDALLSRHDIDKDEMTDGLIDIANAMGPDIGEWVDEDQRESYRIFLAVQTGFIMALKYIEEVNKFHEEVPSTEES